VAKPQQETKPQTSATEVKESVKAKEPKSEPKSKPAAVVMQTGTSAVVSEITINGLSSFSKKGLDVNGGEYIAKVECSGSVKDCKIVTEGDWFTAKIDESGNLKIKYESNPVDKSRRGEVVISSGDQSATLSLQQTAATNRIAANLWFSKVKRLMANPSAVYREGDMYRGHRVDEETREGDGLYWYADNSFYVGSWEANMKNGTGIYVQPSGYYFAGLAHCQIQVANFVDDDADGHLSCYNNRGVLIYEGPASNGKPTAKYPSANPNPKKRFDFLEEGGSYYFGETLDGKKDGYGLYVDSSGTPWVGFWSKDKKVEGSTF
jgi:hypothetical protein